jgi:RNA 2',3'-cyclic 3'-phosphodiesterase
LIEEQERARLFVALELPELVRAGLERWRAPVLRDRPGLRPVAREALHVTLCFLGWRYVDEIPLIAGACQVVADEPGCELTVGKPLWLPPRRPGVLAVALDPHDDALARVQAALSHALQAGGWYVPESRPFLAHVTVARVRKGARVRRGELPAPAAIAVRGSTVTLYRSRLAAGGVRYEPLSSVGLG